MIADADIQVWLQTSERTTPSVIVPYVQSAESRKMQYRVRAVRQGQSGRSELSQSGVIDAIAQQPMALGRMSLTVGKNDQCQLVLSLSADGVPVGDYSFDCRPQELR